MIFCSMLLPNPSVRDPKSARLLDPLLTLLPVRLLYGDKMGVFSLLFFLTEPELLIYGMESIDLNVYRVVLTL
jgi:hypothetical protein